MTEKCAGTTWDGWHSHACQNPAKVERSGRWYCGMHDPERADKLAKAAARRAKYDAESARFRRKAAIERACAGLDLPDDVPAGALTALVEACRASVDGWTNQITGEVAEQLNDIKTTLAALEVRK